MESALREGGAEPGLKLIETLGWDGARLARGERHLARLERSAAALGWGCDVDVARAALMAGREGPVRLRLTQDAAGRIEVQAGPMPVNPAVWRVGLAAVRLEAGDPWLRVKTTRRAVYDAARAALPAGLDEVFFLNGAGEVCEGTITNVFFERAGRLYTPPLTCGLLPGVFREEMLETGRAEEAVLMAEDLSKLRFSVANSLRGMLPALWIA